MMSVPCELSLRKNNGRYQVAFRSVRELSEDELDVYKRGRNTNTHSKAKNATMGQYRKATGLEALYGYLYLKGDMERLQYFVNGMIKQYLAGKEQ